MFVLNITEEMIINYIDYNDVSFPQKNIRHHIRTCPVAVSNNINDIVIALCKQEKQRRRKFLKRNNFDKNKIFGVKFGNGTGNDEESFCMYDDKLWITAIVQEVKE